jgi:hypothetical protein
VLAIYPGVIRTKKLKNPEMKKMKNEEIEQSGRRLGELDARGGRMKK